ncbi:hypothetical protein AMATHDRAFT_60451 [Amanita thiersii Skay4041]|uniref:Cas1p 10 TM acyl transferase domain-containing protein n=1 Tax=Amanita thiersii Skay4041 TaxID=703135 RepID=A0A2A9NJN1_9AGAR|nr:hypothetical protein AMATHDRAFT_60451 [Amanita thiersii Skay4041]
MGPWRSSLFVNPSWPHILALLGYLAAVLFGLFRYVIQDWTDSERCGALLNKGSWLDREQYKWQPDGCILHEYNAREGTACFGTGHILFIGDSTTRKLFYQIAHILDPQLPTAPPNDDRKHMDVHLSTKHRSRVSFVWDPFLNGSRINNLVNSQVDLSSRPSMLVLGSGLWYMRYSNTSGGLPAWESNIERVLQSITTSKIGPAESVVILPVEQLVTSKLSRERAMTMRSSDIDAMNSDLFHRISPPSQGLFHALALRNSTMPVVFPAVFNQMLDTSMTEDGIHYSDPVVKAQATILLNMRCNDVLPKTFPFDKTCCNHYPTISVVHGIILTATIFWGPYLYLSSLQTVNKLDIIAALKSKEAAPLILSSSVILIFLADRTGFWLKEQKHFNEWTFGFLYFVSFLVGLLTVKRGDKDLGFLNREQTDEWKGWMQITILIYHYLGASKISGIYNPIRVLVASYLFMTGFGHTTYYMRKADFGFLRIAQVMVRLNFLTLLLAYTMNTNYLSYYFAPLVSWWYIIIYVTMAVASRYNDRTSFVVCKIIVSALLVTALMHNPRILEIAFGFLRYFCNIQWSAREWSFRVALDLWIVYVGMLSALVFNKFQTLRISDDPRWPFVMKMTIVLSAIVLGWFLIFELLQESKFAYNAWHPYVSFLPVLAFIILRNATVVLRSTHSRAYAFIGRCSLETFIVQYHFWLAGDTKGVLLIIPGTRWRPLNFVVTTYLFVYLCDRIAHATGQITTVICGKVSMTLPTTVPNAPRRGSQAASMSDCTGQSGEKGSTVFVDTPPAEDRVPSILCTFERYISSVQGRLVFGLFVMWMVNLLWTL